MIVVLLVHVSRLCICYVSPKCASHESKRVYLQQLVCSRILPHAEEEVVGWDGMGGVLDIVRAKPNPASERASEPASQPL